MQRQSKRGGWVQIKTKNARGRGAPQEERWNDTPTDSEAKGRGSPPRLNFKGGQKVSHPPMEKNGNTQQLFNFDWIPSTGDERRRELNLDII